METHPYFTKIGANGEVLPREATEWEAVLDNRTGLMWALETKKVTHHNKAEAAAKKIKAGGFDDWRLPTVEELFLLADRTRISPAIDTDFFPDTPSDWFWTSTEYASSPGYAWYVAFNDGDSFPSSRNDNGWVRAVRVGAAKASLNYHRG